MIEYRPAAELGETHLAWLQARHHFCFAGYQDVERLERGRTRYINHDRLAADAELQPSSHFATEMLVIVEDGEIWITRHSGRDFAIGRDRFAYIAAGTGAEFGISNRSIRPASFTTIALSSVADERAVFREAAALFAVPDWLASGTGDDVAHVRLRAAARVKWLKLPGGQATDLHFASEFAYIVVMSGTIDIAHHRMSRHDGLAIRNEACLTITAKTLARVVLIEG